MRLPPKLIGTLRALRWALGRLLLASLVVGIVAAGAYLMFGLPIPDVRGQDEPEPLERSYSSSSGQQPPAQTMTMVADRSDSETVQRINEFREANGKQPFERSEKLERLAQRHSRRMAEQDFYGHNVPGGPTFQERISEVCVAGSENIHRGPVSAEVRVYGGTETVDTRSSIGISAYLVRGWRNSDGHRQNLLDTFDRVGVGVAVSDGEFYATANFC